MASCQDFAEELTALQHVGQVLGVTVHITPKFHAEMAGEGIEYSWAVCKSVYRKMPLDSLIDRLMKIFKTHRAALDFDAGFVESVIPKAIEDVVKLAMNIE